MRGLELEGAPNTRDLGGLATVDGRRVRLGRLYRASALGRLTDADVQTLAGLKLRTVVDLRDISEIVLAPADRLPDPAPAVTALPIYDPQHPVFTYVSAVLQGEDHRDDYAALAEEGTPGAMTAIYRWFVNGAPARARFGSAVRVLARDSGLPALVHCSAGKDRTGWLSAIVLTIVGVSRADIEADYLETNVAAAGVNEAILSAMRERQPSLAPATLRPVFEARPEYLAAAYDEVVRLYDTFDGYLRHGLGLEPGVIGALRANLLD